MKSIADRQAEANPAAAAPPPEQGGEAEQEEFATKGSLDEKDQEAYTRVAMASAEIIYGDKSADQIEAQLQKGAATPEQTVANMAVAILQSIDEKSGNTIPEDIIILPLPEIVEQLVEVGASAGFFEGNQALMDVAMQMAIEKLAPIYGFTEADAQEVLAQASPEEQQRAVAQQSKSAGYEAAMKRAPQQGV
jgi:hypothetical protein